MLVSLASVELKYPAVTVSDNAPDGTNFRNPARLETDLEERALAKHRNRLRKSGVASFANSDRPGRLVVLKEVVFFSVGFENPMTLGNDLEGILTCHFVSPC